MLIRCSEKHREECLSYLRQDPSLNLFFIGDIENYGFNHGFQTIFIDKDEFVHGIYLVYRDCLLISSQENRVDRDFVEKLISEYNIQIIQGRKEVISPLHQEEFLIEECVFCQLEVCRHVYETHQKICQAGPDQIPLLVELINSCLETETSAEMIRSRMEKREGRHYAVIIENKAICQANSTAETSEAAMIGGVATDKAWRHQGLASAVVSQLCRDLLKEGKKPCLFYENEEAGRIYRKIGFEPIGSWIMMVRKK